MLARGSCWKQGSVLKEEDVSRVIPEHEQTGRCSLVVISHDCDLPSDQEPEVELIVAEPVRECHPDYAAAKHPRKLHLTYQYEDGAEAVLSLEHRAKISVSKQTLAELEGPDTSLHLPVREKRSLKQWLAARYGRPAFPDSFESRMSAGKIPEGIKKACRAGSRHLIGLFFDLDEDQEQTLPADCPYFLRIYVVYEGELGEAARTEAEQVSSRLTDLFERRFPDENAPDCICLVGCEAVADTQMPLSDVRRLSQWRLEYLSLRGPDSGEYLPAGEMPA